MSRTVRIALDVMGGDNGPSVTVPGAEIAALRRPDTEYLLFGDEKQIAPLAAKQSRIKSAKIIHTDVAVSMNDKPSQALRRGRKTSSMWLAIEAVKKGEADVAISAGNSSITR
jgi:glycerol-3-phosphate acyltransferase PlsX